MFAKIPEFALKNRLLVLGGVLMLVIAGIVSMRSIPLDAVPDITNNQVQVVTNSPTLAAEEIEQYITAPIERNLANIPGVTELRSLSRYGLSVVTIVFDDGTEIMRARQFVSEQLILAQAEIPDDLGKPSMMPITTGLGEIYQYVLAVSDDHRDQYALSDLRTIQDWIVRRQLTGITGIIDVSSFGGHVRQYEVSFDPQRLVATGISVSEIYDALQQNNENGGGGYIESTDHAFYLRSEGRVQNESDIKAITVAVKNGVPITVADIAEVRIGSPQRYGAMTMDGRGEVVGGITLMLKGASSSETLENVKARVAMIQKSLPPGVSIVPYLDRSRLIDKTINTVTKNLIEGGLIVIFVLVLFLGNFRAGLLVASVIPLSMLFAFVVMEKMGVSANLMSLGAIDFGIIIDGAVIVVEGILHYLHQHHQGQKLTRVQMEESITKSSGKIYNSAGFGVIIILLVFVPLFMLQGIEGKMFMPMAQTVSFAILGSLILSLTYVPVMASLTLSKTVSEDNKLTASMMKWLTRGYERSLKSAIRMPSLVIVSTLIIFLLSMVVFLRMGSEFIPTLEEGDLAMQVSVPPGSALKTSIRTCSEVEKILLSNFPEVIHVVSKIGTAEIPTDPMAIEDSDVMILLKDKDEWVSATSREELIDKMKLALGSIGNASIEFSQPIQLRFNELMTGAKADISVKIFGEDPATLKQLADGAEKIITNIRGAADVKVDRTEGLHQLRVVIDRNMLAANHVNIADVNRVIQTAYSGSSAGLVYESDRRFELVLRMDSNSRKNLSLDNLTVLTGSGGSVPLTSVATIVKETGPMLVSREEGKRRINIGVNVRDRDVASLVADMQVALGKQLKLPPGYTVKYGGQFENLQHAIARLKIAVPAALALILLALYIALGSGTEALIIYMAVPLAAVGGIWALQLRGLPFSISAGIGFIALFGVAVLNGLVLMNELISLRKSSLLAPEKYVIVGALSRLRPVLMTASVASLGFLPMALSNGSGAEVQRPLATVVIGGLVTSTLLTLLIIPVVFILIETRKKAAKLTTLLVALFSAVNLNAQNSTAYGSADLIKFMEANHPAIREMELKTSTWKSMQAAPHTLNPTQVSVQYGQINYSNLDYNVQIIQDVGNLSSARAAKKYAEDGANTTDAEMKAMIINKRLAIKQLYYERAYLQAVIGFLKNSEAEISRSDSALKRQYEAGSISRLKLESALQLSLKCRSQSLQQEYLLIENERMIRTETGIPNTIAIRDTAIVILSGIQSQSPEPAGYLTEPWKNAVTQAEMKTKLIQTRKIPTLSLGYFNQSLESVSAYQGLLIGLNVPILGTGTRREHHISITERDMLNEQYNLMEIGTRNRIQALRSMTQSAAELLKLYPQNYAAQAESMITQAADLLRYGESGPEEYLVHVSYLIDNVLNYYEIVNNHNQNVLELQTITQQ